MKNLRFMAVAVLLSVCASSFAQFTNSSSSSNVTASSKGWSSVWAEYNAATLNIDERGADDLDFTAFSIGWSNAFPIAKGTPIFLEAGVGLQYFSFSDEVDDEEVETKINMFSARVPVNFVYKWNFNNSSFSLLPYIGFNLRYNISGKMKFEYDDDYYDYDDDELDLFDKKDMGKENVCKRLQIGWQVGVKALFNDSFSIGLSYGSDLSEICKKCKSSSTNVSIAYHF